MTTSNITSITTFATQSPPSTPVKKRSPAPQYESPVKDIPITFSPGSQKFHLQSSPNTRKTLSRTDITVVYRIKQKLTFDQIPSAPEPSSTEVKNKFYLGTSDTPMDRFYKHASDLSKKHSSLSRGITNTPGETIHIGVVLTLPGGTDTTEIETDVIKHYKEKGFVYNKRKGGGGGKARKKQTKTGVKTLSVNAIITKLKNKPIEPSSSKIFIDKKNHLSVRFSAQDRKIQNVAYDIIFTPSPSSIGKAETVHHIGTTNRLINRFSTHMSITNNPSGVAAQQVSSGLKTLYENIRKFPKNYSVRVFDVDSLVREGATLRNLEEAFMKYFQNVKKETVRNYGSWGRGPSAK